MFGMLLVVIKTSIHSACIEGSPASMMKLDVLIGLMTPGKKNLPLSLFRSSPVVSSWLFIFSQVTEYLGREWRQLVQVVSWPLKKLYSWNEQSGSY